MPAKNPADMSLPAKEPRARSGSRNSGRKKKALADAAEVATAPAESLAAPAAAVAATKKRAGARPKRRTSKKALVKQQPPQPPPPPPPTQQKESEEAATKEKRKEAAGVERQDSSEEGDPVANRKQEGQPVQAAALLADAAEAANRASVAQKSASVIRELTEEVELLLLLKGSRGSSGSVGGGAVEGVSGGSGGSGGGVGGRRPARLVLACFSARWCRPCHVFAPKLELLARSYRRVTFVKLDVDKLPDVADQYKVRAVPTFLLFRSGTLMGSVTAASQVKLEELLLSNGATPSSDQEQDLASLMPQHSVQPANTMVSAAKRL